MNVQQASASVASHTSGHFGATKKRLNQRPKCAAQRKSEAAKQRTANSQTWGEDHRTDEGMNTGGVDQQTTADEQITIPLTHDTQ